MRNEVEMVLKGEDIPLEGFGRSIDLLHDILADLDREVSGAKNLRWNVIRLKEASKGLATVPVFSAEDVEVEDYRPSLINAFTYGMQIIEKESRRPPGFTDSALRNAKELTGLINGAVSEVLFQTWAEGHRVPFRVTQHLAANVDELLGGDLSAWGSVEGRAETVTIHSGTYFNLYGGLGGPAVRCNCDRETLDQFQVGDRLLVHGELRTTRRGEIKSVNVEGIRKLRSREELPQAANVRGLTESAGFPSGDEIRSRARGD